MTDQAAVRIDRFLRSSACFTCFQIPGQPRMMREECVRRQFRPLPTTRVRGENVESKRAATCDRYCLSGLCEQGMENRAILGARLTRALARVARKKRKPYNFATYYYGERRA